MTRVEIGITHELKINGDKSWVKLGVVDDFPEGVDLSGAIATMGEKVNEELIKVIQQTVDTVNKYS